MTAGVDIGSVTTKVVIFDQTTEKILSHAITLTGATPKLTAEETLNKAKGLAGVSSKADLKIISTGYGRRCIEFGDKTITEITACAKGSLWIAKKSNLPLPRIIIDLGGQDTKVISIDESGEIVDFVMNDKCAAGTGKFLEVIGSRLGVTVENLSELSEKSKEKITINSTCTVFAETEIVSLIAQNKKIEDIVAALHSAIAERIVNMVRGVGDVVSKPIFFCGGGAKNNAIHKLLQEKLNKKIFLPTIFDPQLVVALGAALLSHQNH